jgi:hypothetical protein
MQIKPREQRALNSVVRPGTRAAVLAPTIIKPPDQKRGKLTKIERHDYIDEAGPFTYDAIEAFPGDLAHVDPLNGMLTIRRGEETLVYAPMKQQEAESLVTGKQGGLGEGDGAAFIAEKSTELARKRSKQGRSGLNRAARRKVSRELGRK